MALRRWHISYCPVGWEWLVRAVAALCYRVRPVHAERLPERGGALLLANHLSYVDVVAIQIAAPRRLRFIAYRGRVPNPWFEWVFRRAGVIVLPGRQPAGAIRAAIDAVRRGEVVCLFPEGAISRTGQLMKLQRGFEVIARRARVPVVPAAVDGLWGSVFSFAGGRYLWKRPRLGRTSVTVVFGSPMASERATTSGVRQAILELWAEAFGRRPLLDGHLGWEVARSLAADARRTAIVDRGESRRTISAGALYAASAALARRLRRTVPGRRVGILLPPGLGASAANLAVLWAGKIPVNLNCTTGRRAAQHSLDVAEIDTVLTAAPLRQRFPDFPFPARTLDVREEIAACGGRLGLAPWLAAAWLLPRNCAAWLTGCPRRGGDAEAATLFTSGSSGMPKGVVLSHRNLLGNCEQFYAMAILPPRAVMLGCLPLFHSFGFSVTQWFALLYRFGLVTIPSPLDTRKIIETIREEEVTVFVGTPTFLRPMLKRAGPGDLRSLQLAVSGAEKLPDDLRRSFRERFQLPICEGYGLTEMAPVSCVNQPDPAITTATAGAQPGGRPGTVGRLLPGMAARIVDPDTGALRELNEPGMLWLKGPNRFREYLREPERTAAVIQDGWFVTGDLGMFDEDGFLTIQGRRSRFSKLGGEMVPHASIEAALAAALALDPAEAPAVAIVGVPDEAKGEALVLITSLDLSTDRVRTVLTAAGLPNLWVPKVVRRVEKIPLLGTGKLDLAGCAALAR